MATVLDFPNRGSLAGRLALQKDLRDLLEAQGIPSFVVNEAVEKALKWYDCIEPRKIKVAVSPGCEELIHAAAQRVREAYQGIFVDMLRRLAELEAAQAMSGNGTQPQGDRPA